MPGIPFGLIRKIDKPGFPFDVADRQKAPVPAVIAVVPVVAHHKEMSGRHDDRPEVIPDRIIIMIVTFLAINLAVAMDLVGFSDRLIVDEHLFVFDLQRLTGQSDDAFNVVLG